MLQYLLKLTISLSIVYIFYQLFLRRLTFYNWNRWYLLIYSIVCFVIPSVNVFTIIVNQPALRESALINYIPAITQITPVVEKGGNGSAIHINWMQVAVIVIITGMLLMVLRLLIQYYSLFRMRAKAVLLYDDKVKLYHINEPVIPFSFGRGIYVNQHQHSEQELKEIIHHEFIHVKQRHSLDMIWSELLCILNWYNPFAWLLRHDIRQNLEFIADQQVLQTGLDRKQYQYLLLKVIGVNSFSIANNFNFSSLKRRIAMMNKAKSARVHLIRFLFMLPLLVVVLLAFRNTTQRHQQPLSGTVTDTIPTAAKTPPGWKDIQTIDVQETRKVTVRLKNGKIEKYDLTRFEERKAFESKYGSLPEPPTPPTPPALAPPARDYRELPEAPEKPEAVEAPEMAEAPEAPEPPEAPEIAELPKAPVPPAITLQDCLNKKGFCITVANNQGECIVIVKDKNNKIVEAIALTDWNKDKQFENKYGEIPPRKINIIIKQDIKAKPVTLVNVKPLTILDLKPVTNVQVKPATSVNIKLQPTPVKVINSQRINKAETKPITEVNASPVAAVSVKSLSVVWVKSTASVQAKSTANAKVVSSVKVTSAVSSKQAVPVQVAAEPKAASKPAPANPDERL